MCAGVDWATADPLGVRNLLVDACSLAYLGIENDANAALLLDVADGAAAGLVALVRSGSLQRPASASRSTRSRG